MFLLHSFLFSLRTYFFLYAIVECPTEKSGALLLVLPVWFRVYGRKSESIVQPFTVTLAPELIALWDEVTVLTKVFLFSRRHIDERRRQRQRRGFGRLCCLCGSLYAVSCARVHSNQPCWSMLCGVVCEWLEAQRHCVRTALNAFNMIETSK